MLPFNYKTRVKRTTVPGTCNPAIRNHNAKLQRRPVVRAPRAERMDLTVVSQDKHFAILHALNLAFDLVEWGDVREGGQALELVFLGHGGKGTSLGVAGSCGGN